MKIFSCATIGVAVFAMPATAEQFNNSLELGFYSSSRQSSDSSGAADDGPFSGLYVAGQYGRTLGSGLELGVDLRYEALDEDAEDIDDYGRIDTGVLGLHLGTMTASGVYAGGFAGVGYFAAEDGDDTTTGYIVGGEIEKDLGGFAPFAQVAYVSAEPDPDDNAFVGMVYRVGASVEVTPATNVMVSYEGGLSPDIFEDEDESGSFGIFSLSGSYSFTSNIDVVAAVSAETYTANTEDEAREGNFYLGVRYNIGGGQPSALTTPMGAFKAVDWASELD